MLSSHMAEDEGGVYLLICRAVLKQSEVETRRPAWKLLRTYRVMSLLYIYYTRTCDVVVHKSETLIDDRSKVKKTDDKVMIIADS